MTTLKHPNEEVLQRFRHGELVADHARECDEHIALCVQCGERTASLERDEEQVLDLLRSLDEQRVPVRFTEIVTRAQRRRRSAWYRLAASIVLAATALGGAYALPGSPLKQWLRSFVARITRESPAARPSATALARTSQATSGIALTPGTRFVIRFDATSPNGEATVSFTDDSTISVRATQGSATFTSEADRLLVEPRSPGSALAVEIEIPRQAPLVEIQVAGERVFLKEGTRITAAQAAIAGERYRIPLTGTRR